MTDLCIIGHATVDQIEIAGRPARMRPGGTAYHAGHAARRLGLEVAVLTKGHPADRPFLEAALEGLEVRWHDAPSTTRFVNIYPGPSLEERRQRVEGAAGPFAPEELDVQARAYLLGPLLREDLPPACVHRLTGRGRLLALDVQGLLREVRGGEVVPAPYPGLEEILAGIDVLKAGLEEALLATGETSAEAAARALAALGPSEVLVTDGARGSLVLAEGRLHAIPAVRPPRIVDATGCGDAYLAAYLASRLAGEGPREAGHAAAAVASAKIAEPLGPEPALRPEAPEHAR